MIKPAFFAGMSRMWPNGIGQKLASQQIGG
jgi:hypothetical protein